MPELEKEFTVEQDNGKDEVEKEARDKKGKSLDKEEDMIPWEERPGGSIFQRALKAILRAIKYIINPEYRHLAKLMDEYAVESIYNEEKNAKSGYTTRNNV